MSETLRQRRGKKANNGSTPSQDATKSDAKDDNRTPIEQLRDAKTKLVISRDRTADLHAAWRNQMLRMSLIVIFVTLHQFQGPVKSCIEDIKKSNAAEDGQEGKEPISGMQAMGILFGYSFYELLSVVTAFLLTYILLLSIDKTSSLELNNTAYFLCSTLVPIQLGFYFHTQQPVSCIGEGVEEVQRNFPAIIIYHTIVTIAAWFMKGGMDQCEEHVKMVSESIEQFERLEKKLKQKKHIKQGQSAKKK